jgi:5-methylcytosine-specific restriction protein B
VSDGKGSFELKKKHFLQLCEDAEKAPKAQHVLVIDEISRSDAARVFGEALTYLETTKRNIDFHLASGDKVRVPSNVFIIATMNPWDISVAELDYALERRFAYVEMPPQLSILTAKLKENGADEALVEKVSRLFLMLQGRANPMLHLGHAYLMRVHDLDSLQRVWRTQIRPHVAKVTRLEPTELQSVDAAWATIALAEAEPPAKPVEQVAPVATTPPPQPAKPTG